MFHLVFVVATTNTISELPFTAIAEAAAFNRRQQTISGQDNFKKFSVGHYAKPYAH